MLSGQFLIKGLLAGGLEEQATFCPAAVGPETRMGVYHLSSLSPVLLPYHDQLFSG